MSKTIRTLLTAVTTSALLIAGSAAFAEEAAQQSEESAEPRDLSEFLCKDTMRLSGDEREVALALAHGYRLGKMGTTKYQIAELADLTESFIEHCLDHPNDKALEAFMKLGK